VDNQGKSRGTGSELRTDEHGVIRAGKGLFVSADAQAKAQGEVLDMSAALQEIDRLNQQLQQLEMAAEQAQALKADVDSQVQMFEQRLKPLNETVLFSAPEGMALTSGEDMQLAAARNVVVNAGGDISVGTMGNLTTLAGEKLGLFARTGQLSIKSGEGPIDIQAQNASLRLFAENKLTVSSASDISLAGKKRITLIGGGSYLRLEAGKVEYGTTASYMRKVKRTMAAGAASQQPEMPWLADPVKSTASVLMQYLYHDDVPVVGAPFKVTLADGSVREGNLDGAGYLHLEDVPPGSVQVEFGPDIRNYLRKNKIDNQSFVGTSLSEADIDSLIAKHSGGVE
jgi:type VI secretion system secreted protein VgrG